jgi:hypothetical protein
MMNTTQDKNQGQEASQKSPADQWKDWAMKYKTDAGKLAEALRVIAANNSTLTLREFRELAVSRAQQALAAWKVA